MTKRSIGDFLVVSDIDNTLLSMDNGMPSVNRVTIELFCRMGGHFTLATGRTNESVQHHLGQLPLSAPAITCGGTVIYDFRHDLRIKNATLPAAEALRAVRDVMARFPGIGVEVMTADGHIYVVQSNEYTHRHTQYERLIYVLRPLQEIPPRWNKVLFACPPDWMPALRRFVDAQRYEGVYFVATNAMYFEAMPAGVSKASALAELCDYMRIPLENTVVIGDYYNDVGMMRAAGYAVAVANAPAEVRMAARAVTASCDDGGVAQVLYGLLRRMGPAPAPVRQAL